MSSHLAGSSSLSMFVARKIGSACRWSLTSLREKLIMIGDKIIAYARYTVFQMAEAAVPRDLFRRIMELIDGAQAMGRGTMLTATVGPDLRAFRQQKCVRAAAKPAEMTWEDGKGSNLGASGAEILRFSILRRGQ